MRETARVNEWACDRTLLRTAGLNGDEIHLSTTQVFNLTSAKMLDPSTLSTMWLPEWPGTHVPRADLFHHISLPISIKPLRKFLRKAVVVLGDNFGAAAMAWGYMFILHRYRWILESLRHFNLPVLYGPPTAGKTLVANCGAWLNGCTELQIASRCTLSFLMGWFTSSTMPFVWDDPSVPDEVGQLSVDLGNGAVRGKATEAPQVPATACLVTANFDMATVSRYYTRLCVIKMEPSSVEKVPGAARQLEALARDASSALPVVLKGMFNITASEVHETTAGIMPHLPGDIRVAEGVAVALTATQKNLRGSVSLQECLTALGNLPKEQIRDEIVVSDATVKILKSTFARECLLSAEALDKIKTAGGRVNVAGPFLDMSDEELHVPVDEPVEQTQSLEEIVPHVKKATLWRRNGRACLKRPNSVQRGCRKRKHSN
ncbi:hypothetical protein MAR_014153 [Mya arenaria]|uniref:Uncharacterized protein n=1 Tax=Mya arenaria TaxID=6604 RepID=A0ABY7G510_MYAAR|nr:hypothetical protein MAR_014153 [Mya arenaria]